ncbi:ATP-binding protein [Streptomyces sp. NPDC006984]|uniref:sensor histidine kinase n=1 Tax=Streptomyces sp. NPDC006984 TaxID=3155463 RepID=UPI0033C159C3
MTHQSQLCATAPQSLAASWPPVPRGDANGTVTALPTETERAWLDSFQSARHLADADVQRHERRNALHTLRGLQVLARFAEERAGAFAASNGVPLATVEVITRRIGDPLVRAQAVGKLIAAVERGVDFRLRPASWLPDGLEGVGEIGAVFGNLVDNALDAAAGTGRPEPHVEVVLRYDRGTVDLSVYDNGPGVAPHLRDWVFERGSSTKPASPARPRGIGLALVRAVAEARSGSVEVKGRKGGGAVFTVRMRATEQHRGARRHVTRQADAVTSRPLREDR